MNLIDLEKKKVKLGEHTISKNWLNHFINVNIFFFLQKM